MTQSRETSRTTRAIGEVPTFAIATNNGDVGGGEVMLLNIAEALRSLGIDVLVLGPSSPDDLVRLAEERGFRTMMVRARNRREYIASLWRWRLRNRRVPLWCNGLVPSFATAGIGPRLVHLHILPVGVNALAARIARLGAWRTLVPSAFMATKLPGSTVLENWTERIPTTPWEADPQTPMRIGFLGRLTRDKGVDVLAHAMATLSRSSERETRLVLAGENRFGNSADDQVIAGALAPLGDRVDHLGWTGREEFFASVDIAVFPSSWEEPFGLVAAEAMAAGIPFVISDSGALPEVAGGDHPWIARRGDSADLARVIHHAIDDIEHGDETRSTVARVRWEQRYSPTAGERRVAALLRDLSSPRRASDGSR